MSALFVGELARSLDYDACEQVGEGAVAFGETLAAKPEFLAGRRARRDTDVLLLTIGSRQLDTGSEHDVGEQQVDVRLEVVNFLSAVGNLVSSLGYPKTKLLFALLCIVLTRTIYTREFVGKAAHCSRANYYYYYIVVIIHHRTTVLTAIIII